MTTTTAYDGVTIDIITPNLSPILGGVLIAADTSGITLDYGSLGKDFFVGYGFTYNAAGQPLSGTVTDYGAERDGDAGLEVVFRGFSVSIADIVQAASTSPILDDIFLYA